MYPGVNDMKRLKMGGLCLNVNAQIVVLLTKRRNSSKAKREVKIH